MREFGWAVVGPGKIAQRFADAVKQLPDARLVAVHGRDAGRAEAFARAWSEPDNPAVSVFADLETMLATMPEEVEALLARTGTTLAEVQGTVRSVTYRARPGKAPAKSEAGSPEIAACCGTDCCGGTR